MTTKRPSIRAYLESARISPTRAGELELLRLRSLKSADKTANTNAVKEARRA